MGGINVLCLINVCAKVTALWFQGRRIASLFTLLFFNSLFEQFQVQKQSIQLFRRSSRSNEGHGATFGLHISRDDPKLGVHGLLSVVPMSQDGLRGLQILARARGIFWDR
ncbi:hypothetical protein AVEN_238160-1 [Araneus ventricosus]|uniref:Uncharacterized protein n=1 Tax=Araneus ventricosus TaxID=182803 RepID=A0A4Y2KIU9_ARAVE|nr:hypothetical protein AVEN_238160-1 [Araneus ventricosus]